MLPRLIKKCSLALLTTLGCSSVALGASTAITPASHQPGSLMSMLPMFVIFIVVFYFLLVRPQSKRAKEQRQLMNDLQVGDEVSTTGGIVAKIETLNEGYAIINLSDNVRMTVQRSSISAILPKGTLSSIAEK